MQNSKFYRNIPFTLRYIKLYALTESKITFVGAWSLIRLNVKGMFL